MAVKYLFHFVLFFFIYNLPAFSQVDSVSNKSKLIIVFAGDIMGHDGQIAGAYVDSAKSYNYAPTFRYIKDYISEADIALGNLEVTLAGKPFKGYPQFSSPDELAIAARDAGFDILVTANNHALDRGEKGVARTIQMLDSFKISHTGTFLNQAERDSTYPFIIEKNNIRLAILNYTYGTNGLTVDPPYIVNYIDTTQIRIDIEKTRLFSPDYIIVTIHWGIEYERNENSNQRKLAESILKNGADIIIGSHPHVVQPFKYIDISINDSILKRPVFFSMGNFVSNQRAQYKDGGIMAELHLSKNMSFTTLDSLAYLPYWVYREDKSEKSTFYVVPVSKYETMQTDLIFNDDNLFRFNRFARETRELLKGTTESTYYISKKQK